MRKVFGFTVTVLFVLALVLVVHSMVRQMYLHYSEADNVSTYTLETVNENIELRCVQSLDPYAPALWCNYVRKEK